MSRRLFIGGPRDGQWVDVPDGRETWLVSKVQPQGLHAPQRSVEDSVVAYHAVTAILPGWMVPLTFFTTTPTAWDLSVRDLPGMPVNGLTDRDTCPLPGNWMGISYHLNALYRRVRARGYRAAG